MAYFIYSPESLPDPDLMGKPGYTPDAEYIGHGGFRMGVLPAKTWVELPTRTFTLRHHDWTDRAGHKEAIYMEDIAPAIRSKTEARGVVLLDHEPTPEEKKKLEKNAEELNLVFRMKQVEWFENQVREKEVTGFGRTMPTPYENQCYDLLGLTKPYSVEAMRAQRHPGEAVGQQIVDALERLDQRRQQEAKNEKASHTKQPAPMGA